MLVSSFFTEYAEEILIETKSKHIEIKKNPSDSGIRDPRLFLLHILVIAINPQTLRR